MSRFNFTLKHIPETMEKVDRLSRRLDWKISIEKIKITREKDKEVVRVVEEIKKTEVKVLQGDE